MPVSSYRTFPLSLLVFTVSDVLCTLRVKRHKPTLACWRSTRRPSPPPRRKSKQFGVRLKLRGTFLKRQVCMHHACMTAGSIAILRSRRPHASETVERVARGRGPSGDSHAVPARAAPLRATLRGSAETRCRAVRSYGPRPHGSYGRHRGRHRRVVYEAGGRIWTHWVPRGAFGRGDAMFTGGRNRDPMPSGTPAPSPHTMRGRPDHRSASAVPVLTVGAGGRNV